MSNSSPTFALNHMTVPHLSWRDCARLAQALGCVGVEMRGDLATPLFGGEAPETVATFLEDHGLRLLAVAEVSAFNDGSDRAVAKTLELAEMAARAKAEAVILIPAKGQSISLDALCSALNALGRELERFDMRGLIEPLGFAQSSLRSMKVARAAIRETHGPERFGLVHDTFHHALAASNELHSECIEIVHISGVVKEGMAAHFLDQDRGLVDAQDRLGSVPQIKELSAQNCTAPLSFEAFAPQVHRLADPKVALEASISHINGQLAAAAA
ncbi:MAG: TIM barrel protein [Pseudomonadota bacterium]